MNWLADILTKTADIPVHKNLLMSKKIFLTPPVVFSKKYITLYFSILSPYSIFPSTKHKCTNYLLDFLSSFLLIMYVAIKIRLCWSF